MEIVLLGLVSVACLGMYDNLTFRSHIPLINYLINYSLIGCGGTISKNVTYIQSPNYPSAFTSQSQTCTYTVSAAATSKCRP
jgi:hypothetical protein